MLNRSKISLLITTIVQSVWLILILLNFQAIYLFTQGVPGAYPLAILGRIFLFFFPVELFCLIVDMVFLIADLKRSSNRTMLILSFIAVAAVFAFFCILKYCLHCYANAHLVGVV
ncbi:MAG: hypothetical protein IJO56_02800 [Oscillospiraceae bacterium]|nr:hypothetical protein [Oscillospiraceae bacterium]